MADLQENSEWEKGIYQLEETDVVRGGDPDDGGTSNVQAKQLANRTLWLKNNLGILRRLEKVKEATGNPELSVEDVGRLVLMSQVKEITVLPNLSEEPEGVLLILRNVDAAERQTRLMQAAGLEGQLVAYLGVRETVWLAKNNEGGWEVVLHTGHPEEVGKVIYAYKKVPGTLECRGQLVSRSSYPRLWDFVSGLGNSLKTDAQWLSGGVNYSGFFSSGNGTTNFRLPDLRSMFLRGTDNSRGLDLDRPLNYPGGYEADQFAKHTHTEIGPGDVGSHPGGGSGYARPNGTQTNNTGQTGGQETRPKNVGLIPLIKC